MMSGMDNLGRSTEKSGDNQSVDNKSGYLGAGITRVWIVRVAI